MSGAQKVCNACGGEIRMNGYESGPYLIYGGWCPNCQRVTLSIPQEAYDDYGYDVESESVIVAKKVRSLQFMPCGIVDSPEFQFKWTTKPDEERLCSSCTHGCRVVQNGEDKGYGCRINDFKPRFDAQLNPDCKDYEPIEEWYGMGSECRHCYWSCKAIAEGCMCFDRRLNLKDISDYERGHCKKYLYSTIWNFECHGYTECPECGKLARRTKDKVVCGFCGYRGERD